ncbi:MAG: glutamyl-tRNA reductase, partial [Chloroflexota bacterium]
MKLVVVGINHKSAPVDIRERLAVPADSLKDALVYLSRYVRAGAILSTCNRTEVYAVGDSSGNAAQTLVTYLAEYHRLPAAEFAHYLYSYEDEEPVMHL